MEPWFSETSAWKQIICHITVVGNFTHLASNVQGTLMAVSKTRISLASQYLQSTQSKLHRDPFPLEINAWHEDWPVWLRAYGDGQGKQRTVIFFFFWKYLNQRAMSASSGTGQIQVNTFFCLRILRLFILALHNQYILLLSKKKKIKENIGCYSLYWNLKVPVC